MQKESRFENTHWTHQDVHDTSWNSNHFSSWAFRWRKQGRDVLPQPWMNSCNHGIFNLQVTCGVVGSNGYVCIGSKASYSCWPVQALTRNDNVVLKQKHGHWSKGRDFDFVEMADSTSMIEACCEWWTQAYRYCEIDLQEKLRGYIWGLWLASTQIALIIKTEQHDVLYFLLQDQPLCVDSRVGHVEEEVIRSWHERDVPYVMGRDLRVVRERQLHDDESKTITYDRRGPAVWWITNKRNTTAWLFWLLWENFFSTTDGDDAWRSLTCWGHALLSDVETNVRGVRSGVFSRPYILQEWRRWSWRQTWRWQSQRLRLWTFKSRSTRILSRISWRIQFAVRRQYWQVRWYQSTWLRSKDRAFTDSSPLIDEMSSLWSLCIFPVNHYEQVYAKSDFANLFDGKLAGSTKWKDWKKKNA